MMTPQHTQTSEIVTSASTDTNAFAQSIHCPTNRAMKTLYPRTIAPFKLLWSAKPMWAKGRSWVTVRLCPFLSAQFGCNSSNGYRWYNQFAEAIFKPDAPLTSKSALVWAQVGGNGKNDPTRNFVGIGKCAAGPNCAFLAGEMGLNNLKLISGDAIALMQQLPAAHIDTLQLYFPDPWQKSAITNAVCQVPIAWGWWNGCWKRRHISCCHRLEHYAHWMIEVMDGLTAFENVEAKAERYR